jgi:hypothetical protein
MVEIQFDIQVWGLLFFALRSTEFLNFNPKLGEVFLILCEMMKETVWVFFYMLFFSFWAGVALSTGQQQAKYLEENRYDTDMRHWGMAGLWAILGSLRSDERSYLCTRCRYAISDVRLSLCV